MLGLANSVIRIASEPSEPDGEYMSELLLGIYYSSLSRFHFTAETEDYRNKPATMAALSLYAWSAMALAGL